MTFQRLMEGARYSKKTQAAITLLPAYVTESQSVFTKEDFDILLEHRKWDHAIELIPRAEPKSSKVYPLSPLEQAELDAFCKEAKLQAGMKPTALCSAIDKENSIESPLDFTTLYIQLLSWLCTLSPTVLMPVS